MLDSLLLSKSQRALLETTTRQYAENVEEVGSYLGLRGIEREDALGARLGLVSDPPPEHARFDGMLSIPYLTPAGVVGIKFRCLEDHDCKKFDHSKYDQPSQHPRLYNAGVMADTSSEVVCICEGELDALLCSARIAPAVGAPGTQWHAHWTRCFADFDSIVVIADHDVKEDGSSPGLAHGKKLQRELGSRAKVIRPPVGMDLTDWFLAEGAGPIKEAVLG